MTDFVSQFKATKLFDDIIWKLRSKLPLRTNRVRMSSIENSFVGKEAVECLLAELPKLVPDKTIERPKAVKLLQVMIEMKVITDPVNRKADKSGFKESRIYIFAAPPSDSRDTRTKSRRSASFNGRKTDKVASAQTSKTPSKFSYEPETFNVPKVRRLSRSNGNLDKLTTSSTAILPAYVSSGSTSGEASAGHENKGFDENVPEDVDLEKESKEGHYTKKEKAYDWLPFFKQKGSVSKGCNHNQKTAKRSVSLDRHKHSVLYGDPQTNPVPRHAVDDLVTLHPNGALSGSISRTKMYESIARRPQLAPIRDIMIWKTELITRMTTLIGSPPPSDWSHRIDALDVQWNANPMNLEPNDGVVKSKLNGIQPDYPASVVHFMEYLSRFPFSKKTELIPDEKVVKLFATLVNRLGDLDPPLFPEEARMIIAILKKHQHFENIFTNANTPKKWTSTGFRRTSISDDAPGLMVNGFTKELPVCGIRASKHRRRAFSPARCLDSGTQFLIEEENEYKLREEWQIEALQLCLLALPTNRRRKLHKFVMFLRSVATNEVIEICDPSTGARNNREALLIGMHVGVCGSFDKIQGILITAVFLANHRVLFSIPEKFPEKVRSMSMGGGEPDHTALYAKVVRGRKLCRALNDYDTFQKTENDVKLPQRKDDKKPSFFNRLLKK